MSEADSTSIVDSIPATFLMFATYFHLILSGDRSIRRRVSKISKNENAECMLPVGNGSGS